MTNAAPEVFAVASIVRVKGDIENKEHYLIQKCNVGVYYYQDDADSDGNEEPDTFMSANYSIRGHSKLNTQGVNMAWLDHNSFELVEAPSQKSMRLLYEACNNYDAPDGKRWQR